jgi:hypothetical protein
MEGLKRHSIHAWLGAGGHTYNPSYSGGRDQQDHGLEPA